MQLSILKLLSIVVVGLAAYVSATAIPDAQIDPDLFCKLVSACDHYGCSVCT